MKSTKYIEIPNIVQVIGCIYKNPKILENTERYKFNEQDFCDDFHKVVFGSMYNLWQLGAKEFTLPAIEDYLNQRPKALATYKAHKGPEFLLKAAEIANLNTFDYYYNRMKKMSLLRAYEDMGMDLTWLYNPDEVMDMKKKQQQEDWIDNSSLEDIYNKINDLVDSIKLQYVDNMTECGCQIGQGIDELINSFAETPAVGYPLYDAYLTTTARGARLGKFYLRSAATNVGKAIPDYTEIPTPTGFRKVGDIKVGDYLFGQDGKPTKVLAVYPQEHEKEIWEVHFSDGRVAECCGEHLWEYRYETHRGKAYRVENIKTIYEKALSLKNGLRDSCNKGYRFHIRLNEGVEYEDKKFSINPYVLGALLGDGSFRYGKTNKALTFSSISDKLPNKIANLLGSDYFAKKSSDYNYSYVFKNKNNPEHNLWVEELLNDYPELWNAKSEDKFIPQEYLFGSLEQRYALLRGLLDTDGGIDIRGVVTFTTVSPKLRDNVISLCRSLGFVANYLTDDRSDKYTTGECYRVTIQSKKELKPSLFSLEAKKMIATEYANSDRRCEYKDHLAITNIIKTTQKTKMTCFTVDNKEHLFLMNDFIVTHNTRAMIGDACYIGCSQMFSIEEDKWVDTGAAQSCLFIATEQTIDEIQVSTIAFLSGVEEDHIVMSEYYVGEWDRIVKAKMLLKQSKIQFVCIPDFSMQDIENIIKKHVRENQISYAFYDYIHSSAKILTEIGGKSGVKNLREDNILFLLASKLKEIAVQYGIFILSSTQLNAMYQESSTPDQNLLRGSKAVADRIDWGGIMLEATKEDKEKLKDMCEKNGLPLPNVKLSVYKNRANRWKGIYLWMKTQTGICRFDTLFVTDWNFNVMEMPLLKIEVESSSAF